MIHNKEERPILVRPLPSGDYNVTMWFLGHKWFLSNIGIYRTWMIRHETGIAWSPLKHMSDTDGHTGTPRRMSHGDDSVMAAITQAKFQILRLRYRKLTPTFHEQHLHYFSSPLSVA